MPLEGIQVQVEKVKAGRKEVKFLVIRDGGTILDQKRYSAKTAKKDTRKAMKDGTFSESEKVFFRPNWKVREYSSINVNHKIRKGATHFQYFVAAKLRDGENIHARSSSYPIKKSEMAHAKKEAYYNFYTILAYHQTGKSDEEVGKRVYMKTVKSIKTGVVYYIAR